MLAPLLLIILLRYTAEATWTAKQAAKLSQDAMVPRFIPCAVVAHPGERPPEKVYQVVKEMQKSDRSTFHTVAAGPLLRYRSFAEKCVRTMFIVFAEFPNARQEIQKVMNSSKYSKHEATWLILLPSSKTHEQFFGESRIPFLWHVVSTPFQSTALLREVWRVGLRYPLRNDYYASWSEKDGLMCKRDQCQYNRRTNLEGYPIVAATKEDMPLSRLALLDNGTLGIEGYFGDVYYELLGRLNATPVVVQAVENVTGSAQDGQWNGLIGMLARGQIDMGVGPLTVHRVSMDVIDFVRPLLRTHYQVFFKQSGTVVEWDAFLKPFAKFVWRLIVLSMIVAAVYLHFFYRIGVRNHLEDDLYTWEYNMVNSYFTFIKALCHQGTDLMPSSLSCRVLYLTGYLTFLILHTAYSAALISKLTTQEPLRPFDSLESFHKDGSYKLTAIGASTDYTYFSEATDSTLRAIYERQMMKTNVPTGKEEGLMAVCERDKTALFITYAVTQISAGQISASNKCPILVFKNPLGIVSLTIGLKKKMPFIPLITQQVQAMAEQGILKRLQRKEWPPYPSINTDSRTSQVEIQQVAQIHIVFLIGIGLSLIILCCEIVLASPRTTRMRRKLFPKENISSDCVTGAVFWGAGIFIVVTLLIAVV